MISLKMAGWVTCGLMAVGGPVCFAGMGGAGGWVVDGVAHGAAGTGPAGSVAAQSVIYSNGPYSNLQAAIDALFIAVGTNAVNTNPVVSCAYGEYVLAGLRDNTGKGSVTLACFNPYAQLWHATRGLPEAGASVVATLLDGVVKEHYKPSKFVMTGITSLGWAQYDLFIYGGKGTFRCWNSSNAEVSPQTCTGLNPLNATHRTQFIVGTNYVKFAGLYGDNFRVEFPENEFSGIQIVKSGSGANPEGIGVRWTGGGLLLASTNGVGAEVVCGGWYNIDPDGVIYH